MSAIGVEWIEEAKVSLFVIHLAYWYCIKTSYFFSLLQVDLFGQEGVPEIRLLQLLHGCGWERAGDGDHAWRTQRQQQELHGRGWCQN